MSAQPTQQNASKAAAVHADAGQALWWFNSLAVIKAAAADTGGAFTLLEITDPPGEETGRFVSQNYDMGCWILNGGMAIEVDGATVEAGPGDFVFIPRGVPQGHQAGDDGCHWLLLSTPGGLEDLALTIGQPATSRTLPPTPVELTDPQLLVQLGNRHGIQPLS
jgi:quercetin dioxygenase-like cupin family protein